jgi:putative ABC transport system permease protein
MREAHFLKVVARLKPGVSVAQAQSEMSGVARRLAEQYPQTNRNWGANVVPLAALGGAAGLIVGGWALEALLAMAPENLPRLGEVRLDVGVLGFTLLLSLLTGALFGLAPAWQASRMDVNSTLKQSAGRLSGHRRLFGALVVAEIALTLAVLLGAGLLVNSFWRLRRVEPGLDVDRLLTVTFEPPSAQYNGDDWRARRLNFWDQLSARVAALPGVEAVGAIDSLPFSGRARVWRFRRESDDVNVATGPAASFQVTTPDYFRAVGMKLRRGRLFNSGDRENTPPVAIINETMARQFWPGAEILGQRIVIRNESFAREIIGVVSDVKHFGLDRETEPEMYAPFAQFVIDVMPLVARVQGDPAKYAGAIRQQARAVDPTVAIESAAPMREIISDSLAQRRFTMLLLGLFAAVALLLAGVGVYGVMAYSVSARTREIGVRMALGAQARDVLHLVMKQGLKLVSVGLAIGLLGASVSARLMNDLLFGVGATDPVTFVAVALLLAVVALVACWIPGRRAAKVDPMIALRYE